MANSNFPILQSTRIEHVDGQSDDFGFGKRPRGTNQLNAVLEKFTVATFLELLIAVALAIIGKSQWFGVVAHFFCNHAHDWSREFRAKRQWPSTLVFKRIQLADNARARFGGEQIKRLEHRSLHPFESVTTSALLQEMLERKTAIHHPGSEVTGPSRALHHASCHSLTVHHPFALKRGETVGSFLFFAAGNPLDIPCVFIGQFIVAFPLNHIVWVTVNQGLGVG